MALIQQRVKNPKQTVRFTPVARRITAVVGMVLLIAWTGFSHWYSVPESHAQAASQSKWTLRFVSVIGRHGSLPGQFLNPNGISVDPIGNLYVADTGNNRIQKFDPLGRFIVYIGGFGFNPREFDQPTDVTGQLGLDVYVVDSQNQRIQRFDRHLNYLGQFAEGGGNGGFPLGILGSIAISPLGELYVTDRDNEEVIKFSATGKLETRFGGFTHAKGRLRNPTGLAVGPNQEVLVADTGNNRVVVYDRFGGFLRVLGEGILANPEGVSVDRQRRVFVADTGHDRIVGFTPEGGCLMQVGSRGDRLGAFKEPRDVAVANDGTIYVADSGNHRVQRFEIVRVTGAN